jgi:hypothetical protein
MRLIDSLAIAYLLTGMIFSLYTSIMEIKSDIARCNDTTKEEYAEFDLLHESLVQMEVNIGTHATLLLHSINVFLQNVDLIATWPMEAGSNNKSNG